jgi:hypothetical protein
MSETDYTTPEDRGVCGFCGKEENGYAMKDSDGKFKSACWNCIKKDRVISDQPKREQVGTAYTEDLDADDKIAPNPGMKSGRRKRTL